MECEDGIDNDGDGLVDYPSDPGCTSASDNDETNVGTLRALWSDNSVEITFLNVVPDFTSVELVLENSGLSQGTNLAFDIREKELFLDTSIRTIVGTTDSNGRVVAIWLITSEDLDKATDFEEFYFVVNGEQSGTLTLNVLDDYCLDKFTCKDYEQALCEDDLCNIAEDSVPEFIDCSDSDINCYCTQNENTCASAFSVSLPTSYGDGIIDAGETCDESNWGPITGCTDFDEFTGGI